jgi:glycosyltransferase involved in cell wall biosynthesis
MSLSVGLSIVIPVYNRAGILERTLDSVSAQTYRPIQLIIVDNNSSDDSLAVAERWKSAHEADNFAVEVMKESSPGACSARNAGFAQVKYDITAFFDSDDVMRPTYAETIMKAFADNQEADIVYWRKLLHNIDGSLRNIKFATSHPLENHIYHALLSTQGFAAKTAIIRSIGGWNEHLAVWNDWELGIRILLHTNKYSAIDTTLVDIYSQRESITGIAFSDKVGEWEQSIDIAYQDVADSNHPQRERLLRMLDYRRVVLAAHYYREGDKISAQDLFNQTISRQSSKRVRLLFRFTYGYVKLGLRGCATIINPFI